MNLKKKLCTLVILAGTFVTVGSGVNSLKLDNSDQNVAKASVVNTNDEFIKAYNIGINKKIINSSDMSQSEFISLCKDSVYPAYLQAVKDRPTLTFQQYIAEDNYEQPIEQPGDNPTTVTAETHTSNVSGRLKTAAHNGYSMKPGDILVVYGRDASASLIGHAAIATSSKFVLEMPGPGRGAAHTSKSAFFKLNTKGKRYVAVYRIKKHPTYAAHAQNYAWNHMYKKTRPNKYFISTNLYHKSPSYCSKYVYLAYYWGATKKAVKYYPSNLHIVSPHGLVGNFVGSFKPNWIHKITSY